MRADSIRDRLHIAIACALLLVACTTSAPRGASNSTTDQGTAGTSSTSGNPITGTNPGPGSSVAGGMSGPGSGAAASPAGGSSGANGSNNPGTMRGGSGGAAAAGGMGSGPRDMGNYFVSGPWMGYVWTSTSGAGTTISPMDFASQSTGMPRCVKGSVAAVADYSGTAILGVNLSEGNGATSMTVTPMKAGVLIDVTNKAGSPLRFQVKSAPTGGTEWCTAINGSGGFIPWTSLRTKCWDSTGTAYNREPIVSAMILVPGTNTAPVAFDFCLNSLVEADAPAGGSAGTGASGMGGAGTGSSGKGGSGTGGVSGAGGPTVPPLTNGCPGFATRYWDCCKPHCGWSSNAPSGPLASCDVSGNSLGGNVDAANSCQGGPAYLCQSNAPWALSSQLAYGFAAVAAATGSDICGKCYQLDFSGTSRNGDGDPGSAALAGKSMIVQAINIGGDVGSGQFDIATPGGGVGAFNACSTQWGVSPSQLGAQYGGFLADCKQTVNASDLQALKDCVSQKCMGVFDAKGLTELAAGCKWFVDWFEVADNPNLKYAEVACPAEIQNRGMHRSGGGGACL